MGWTRGNVVRSILFVDANRDDDAPSYPGTAVHAYRPRAIAAAIKLLWRWCGLRKDYFHSQSLNLDVHIKRVLCWSGGPPRIVSLRCKKFQIKAGTKTLRIHFGCNFDSVEASLSLPVVLLLNHPQTTHSL